MRRHDAPALIYAAFGILTTGGACCAIAGGGEFGLLNLEAAGKDDGVFGR
jgi:hypothetical protein